MYAEVCPRYQRTFPGAAASVPRKIELNWCGYAHFLFFSGWPLERAASRRLFLCAQCLSDYVRRRLAFFVVDCMELDGFWFLRFVFGRRTSASRTLQMAHTRLFGRPCRYGPWSQHSCLSHCQALPSHLDLRDRKSVV